MAVLAMCYSQYQSKAPLCTSQGTARSGLGLARDRDVLSHRCMPSLEHMRGKRWLLWLEDLRFLIKELGNDLAAQQHHVQVQRTQC